MKKIFLLAAICTLITQAQSQTWNLTGNTGTNGSTNFIGTTDNVAFKIRTKNVVRITVNGSGKVGIGNSYPVWKLDVKGGSINTDSLFRINGVQVLTRNALNNLQLGDATSKIGIGTSAPATTLHVNGVITATGGNSTNWNSAYGWGNHALAGYLSSYAESDPQIGSNTSSRVPRWNGTALVTGIIYDNGTNLGINTIAPAGKFHIKGSANAPQLIIDANATQGNTSPLIKLRNNSGADLLWIHSDDSSNCFVGLHAGSVNNVAGFGTDNTFIGGNAGFSNTIGYWNTAIGRGALNSNTEGVFNTATGVEALYSNTTGYQNTAAGVRALYSNTVGGNNTATGWHAMQLNTTGYQNSAYGVGVLLANTEGYANTANGYTALQVNTTGYQNTATGTQALYLNSTGNNNTANGNAALYNNSTGNENTASGANALYTNTTGFYNTAHGKDALYANTTGYCNTANGYAANSLNSTGYFNTANGYAALAYNSTGNENSANGTHALFASTIGNKNTASGAYALRYNTTGNYNTAAGSNSLFNNSSGSFNTAIGYQAGFNQGQNPSNYTALGYDAGHVASNTNEMELGNTSVTWIGGQSGFFNYSDRRVKDNIQSNVPGLSFITRLNPVTYNLNIHRQNEMCGINDTNEWEGKYDIEKIIQTGFLAQEVEQAALACNYDFNGVKAPHGNAKLYSVQYASFVVPLVKAVQELNKQNAELLKRIELLESKNGVENKNKAGNLIDKGILPEQNHPNPFSETTTIKFNIPLTAQQAELKIFSADGKEIKTIRISTRGKGQIEINGNTLAAGIYNYTLLIDEEVTGSRQMILTK